MVSRSLGANPDDLKDPIKISIPRYVLCGQGKDEHFEFEVKVSVPSSLFWRLEARGSAVLFLCVCVKGDNATQAHALLYSTGRVLL